MAKTVEENQTVTELLRELESMPPGRMLTDDEFEAIVRRMPKMPEGWTSADAIRELRGPLPEDDAEYQRNHGRR